MNGLTSLLPLLLIVLLVYLLMVRPQQKRRRQLAELQNNLHTGQRVMTTSGLIATVSTVDDDNVLLEVAPGVDCRYSKAAVVQVLGNQFDDSDNLDRDDTVDEAETTDDDDPERRTLAEARTESVDGDREAATERRAAARSRRRDTPPA